MNGTAVVKAELLNKKDANGVSQLVLDKNGIPAIILTPIAGSLPSKRTISGSYAQRQQIFEGGLYAVDYTENAVDPTYGRTFQFNNLGPIDPLKVASARKEYGDGTIVTV